MSEKDLHSEAPGSATDGAASSSGERQGKAGAADPGVEEKATGSSRITRLAGESRALFDDLREWVDLRVQLVQVEIEERIEKAVNEAIALILVAIVGLFALAFLLHGVAIWIGTALGGQQWGYLILAAILAVVTLILKTATPDFIGKRKEGSGKQLDQSSSDRLRLQAGEGGDEEAVEKPEEATDG